MASILTNNSTLCSTACSGLQERKQQSSSLLAPLWGESTVDCWFPLTKRQWFRKNFHVMICHHAVMLIITHYRRRLIYVLPHSLSPAFTPGYTNLTKAQPTTQAHVPHTTALPDVVSDAPEVSQDGNHSSPALTTVPEEEGTDSHAAASSDSSELGWHQGFTNSILSALLSSANITSVPHSTAASGNITEGFPLRDHTAASLRTAAVPEALHTTTAWTELVVGEVLNQQTPQETKPSHAQTLALSVTISSTTVTAASPNILHESSKNSTSHDLTPDNRYTISPTLPPLPSPALSVTSQSLTGATTFSNYIDHPNAIPPAAPSTLPASPVLAANDNADFSNAVPTVPAGPWPLVRRTSPATATAFGEEYKYSSGRTEETPSLVTPGDNGGTTTTRNPSSGESQENTQGGSSTVSKNNVPNNSLESATTYGLTSVSPTHPAHGPVRSGNGFDGDMTYLTSAWPVLHAIIPSLGHNIPRNHGKLLRYLITNWTQITPMLSDLL